jgi:hypothetical protein
MTRADEVKRIHAEGLTANVGDVNPYYGQLVNAAVWRQGYRRMLDDELSSTPVRRRWSPRIN